MKILTIGIPTFNRPDRLNNILLQLHRSKVFLMGDVQVIVQDNSDPHIQVINKKNCSYFNCIYSANLFNLGFGGNLLAILNASNAHYMWYLSDDDLIHENIVSAIVDFLKKKKPNITMLPYTINGESACYNTKKSWNSASSISQLYEESVPFLLFSSFIFFLPLGPVSAKNLSLSLAPYADNPYLHILMPSFLEKAVGKTLKVEYFKLPCIDYVQSTCLDYSLLDTYKGLSHVLFIIAELQCQNPPFLSTENNNLLRSSLIMLLQSKAGFRIFKNYKYEIWDFFILGLKSQKMVNVLLATIVFLPSPLIKLLFKIRATCFLKA